MCVVVGAVCGGGAVDGGAVDGGACAVCGDATVLHVKVKSNGGIVVRGTSANVLVEGSRIAQSDVGIYVNYTTTRGGVVLRNNVEPDGVPPNFNPYANTE